MTKHRRWGRLTVAVAVTGMAATAAAVLPSVTAAASVPAPTTLNPNDASTTQYNHLELRWRAVTGATSYEVQVSDSGDFGADVLTGTSTLTRWTPPVSLPRGDYAWRVRAKSGSTAGAWSAIGFFTRGWDSAPGGAVQFAEGGPLPAISWAPMPDASFYEVEFSRVPFDAGSGVYEGTAEHYTCYTMHTYLAPYGVIAGSENPPGDEKGCSFDVDPKAADGDFKLDGKFHAGTTYYWRVRGRDSSVDTRTTPFVDPALSCTGAWMESGATVASAPAPTTTTTPDPTTTATAPVQPVVTVPIGGEPPKYDPQPACSEWLSGGQFTVSDLIGTDRPPAPSGLRVEPTAGDASASVVAATDTPLFRWTPVAGAAKYRVYVGRTADFRDADHVWETFGSSLMPLGTFANRGLKTYWTVQACTANALCSNPAPAHAFTKASKVTAKPKSASISGAEATLTWNLQLASNASGQRVPGVAGARAYRVQVALGGDFSHPLLDVTTDRIADRADTTTSRYTFPSSRLNTGVYQWRVGAVDETNTLLGWSTAGTFMKGNPVATLAIARPGFSQTGPVLLKFSEPVTGVSTSTLGIVTAGTSTKVAGSLTYAGTNTWKFTPSHPLLTGQYYAPWLSTAVKAYAGRAVSVNRTPVRATTVADSASVATVKRSGDQGWSLVTASDAVGRSFARTSDNPRTSTKASVTATGKGRTVSVYACRNNRSGVAQIYVDGHLRKTIDLYQSYSGCARVWSWSTGSTTTHTVVVRPSGTKRSVSRGYELDVDAIAIS